ncbi:tetratricopeptide repeat protein [Uliginosibacterium gangwonense]|uniref:tetratricopeptide repeat protein n=1 Tax=Uliginosibacterium gangwonense TaxID=392736 RepID=UPI000365625C|nr:tetratricopeptide repeat protein [Uliginosibacterium gangwonense]
MSQRLDPSLLTRSLAVLMLGIFTCGPVAAQISRSEPLPDSITAQLNKRQYTKAYPELVRYADAGNHEAQFTLANYHVCARGVPFDCNKALELFAAAALPSNNPNSQEIVLSAKNEIAWIHAACEQADFHRDLTVALEYAQEAAQDGSPFHQDTLAAALARLGRFTEAAQLQQQALDGLQALEGEDKAPTYVVREFRSRLKLYKANRPARFGKWNAEANCNALP